MRKFVLSAAVLTSVVAVSACGSDTASQDVAAQPDASAEIETVAAEEPEAVVTFADLTGDAAAGEAVFVQCQVCHQLEEGKNGVGPSLHGVIGREAGSVAGFNYSSANAESGIIWTPETLYEFLESPREYLPGNRMSYPGLRDAQARADLIAFLGTNGE